jgi:hypothetical protein
MATLDDEIAAYNEIRDDLESQHRGEWALVHDRKLFGTFASFQQAAASALKNFGRGPYLIRRIGASPLPLPISVIYALPSDGAN